MARNYPRIKMGKLDRWCEKGAGGLEIVWLLHFFLYHFLVGRVFIEMKLSQTSDSGATPNPRKGLKLKRRFSTRMTSVVCF